MLKFHGTMDSFCRGKMIPTRDFIQSKREIVQHFSSIRTEKYHTKQQKNGRPRKN